VKGSGLINVFSFSPRLLCSVLRSCQVIQVSVHKLDMVVLTSSSKRHFFFLWLQPFLVQGYTLVCSSSCLLSRRFGSLDASYPGPLVLCRPPLKCSNLGHVTIPSPSAGPTDHDLQTSDGGSGGRVWLLPSSFRIPSPMVMSFTLFFLEPRYAHFLLSVTLEDFFHPGVVLVAPIFFPLPVSSVRTDRELMSDVFFLPSPFPLTTLFSYFAQRTLASV